MNRLCVLLILAGAATAQSSVTVPKAKSTTAGDASRGKELYIKFSCYACHDFDGHGGAGARLVPMKLMLPVFTAYIRSPRQMPAYREKVMSDADVADVWAFVKMIPESPPAKSIPLLNDEQ